MTKLSKKKKILISVLTITGAILITAAVLVGLIFRPANIPEREDLGFETVCYELPDDNDPTAHTGIENIGYMNWRLQHQTMWYSEAHVFVDNSTDDQNVSTYKQYHNGVLISTDISKSNLVNKAAQYCQVRGGNVVLFRNAAGGKSKYNGINTPWTTGKPDGHTIAEYKVKKGLPPLEFSVYILNENTVKEYSDVIDNGNGTYSQTFILNYESEPAENDATYWYKTEMVYKANGMMKADPQFSEVKVTYTFDDTWQILSTNIREVYKTITGVGGVNCVAEGTTEYTYGNEELSYNPEYEKFYRNYMADYEVPEDVVVDAALCLSEAFGGMVQEESVLEVDLSLDELQLSGAIQLNLNENDIRVDLGDVKVYMREEKDQKQYLYVAYGENIKAKICLTDVTAGTPAAMAEEEEESSFIDNLLAALGDDECFSLAEDKRSATLTPTIDLGELLGADLDIVVNLQFKFNISEQNEITLDNLTATGTVFGMDLNAELCFGKTGVAALTETEAAGYTQINAEIFTAVEKIVNLIKTKQITVKGVLEIAGAELTLNNLAVSWVDGIDVKAEITLNIDGFQKAVYFRYDAEKIAVYFDEISVELAQSDVENFAEAITNLYEAIAAETGTDGSEFAEAIDFEALIEFITSFAESEDFDILEIIGAIILSDNGEGKLVITYGDLALEISVDGEGNLVAGIAYGDTVYADVAVIDYAEVELPSNCSVLNVAELISLLNDITEIITNKGITVSGVITFGGESQTTLTLYGLSVGWANGIELQLDARISVDGDVHDFYAKYSATTGDLTIVYGALDGGAGISLNVENDVQTLEDALVNLYNRIAAVANNMANDDVLPAVGSLNELLEIISAGKDAASGVAAMAETIDEIESEQPSIGDILASIEIKSENGRLSLDIGGLTLMVWSADGGFNISLQTEALVIEISDVKIVATETTDFEIEVEKALSAEDIADLCDYVAATVELLTAERFSIELSGTVISEEEAYAEVENNVKYNISAGFEYSQGESGFPVHVVPEGQTDDGEPTPPDFWIAPDIYVHLYVNMLSTIPEVDSLLLDAYIFDGTPKIGEDGKTTKDELTSGNNELDVYLSVSRIPADQANVEGVTGASEPLKVYAPMNEIMTVLSAGLALVDVGSISIDALPEVNGIITQIGEILDVMLVDRYFGDTKDQFVSLGKGLMESIIGGSISDLLNNLVNGVLGGEQTGEEEVEAISARAVGGGFERERFGLLNVDIARENGNSTLTLKVGETTSTVSKETYTYTVIENDETCERTGSRLTGLTVDTSALNETDTLNNLNINLSYGEVERVTVLSGYTSFAGADELVKALVNSATHEVPAEEQTEENSAKYALNNSFFIDGELSVTVSLMNFNLANHIVTIDGLYVSIDENGEVEVNARLHYSGKAVLVTLVNGNSTVDLTIKNGMVYIKRVQTTSTSALSNKSITPITIYRAMPIDVFMGDIMNQIFFILNFNESIAGMIPSGGDDGNSESELKKDYGTQLAEYFNYLTFTEDAEKGTARWVAQINGSGLSNLAGINISDITATFDAERDTETDNYVVKGLGLKGSLFGMLQFNANLDWQNPKQQWRVLSVVDNGDETFTEVTAESSLNTVLENDPSINLSKWLGGSTYEEICASIDWNKLPTVSTVESKDENGEKVTTTYRYFELKFTGDAELPSGTVKFGTLEYYYKTADGEEVLLSSVENILYYGSTMLSIVEAPDLTEYEIEHYNLQWQAAVVQGSTVKIVAEYVPAEYQVTFNSEYEIEGYLHVYGNQLTFNFGYETDWHKIDYIEYKGVQYTAENYTEIVIDGDAEIYVHWVEIPGVHVTYASEFEVEGFTYNQNSGYWENVVKYRTDKEITLDSEYVIDGYDFIGYVDVNGEAVEEYTLTLTEDVTYYLQWKGNRVTVKYFSSLQFEGSDEVSGISGYETAYTSTVLMSNDYTAATLSAEGYMFLGWYYLGADGWVIVGDVLADIPNASAGNTYELHALWAVVSVEGSGTYTTSRVLFSTYYNYKLSASVSVEFVGNADLVNNVTLSSATFSFAVADKTASASSSTLADGKLSVSDVAPERTTKSATTASVTVTFKIGVGGEAVDGSWSATQSGLSVTAA